MKEKTTAECIKEIREMWNPGQQDDGTIVNLLRSFASLPSTPMENIPTQPQATSAAAPDGAAMPEAQLSQDYPYGGE
ncbi:MAG: hypothetical protein WC541_09410 [Dehalococcoidia bacterium]